MTTECRGVCGYTAICEQDAFWIDQYVREAPRLGLPFVVHFDRCSDETKARMLRSPHCYGHTAQDDPTREFDETHKQAAFDLVQSLQFRWALAWDMDETWAADAREHMDALKHEQAELLTYRWVNLWGDRKHIRIDGPMATGRRTNLYRLDAGIKWEFKRPDVNGAYADREVTKRDCLDLICVHHGMMTPELRRQRKDRWDRIYTASSGKNPHGFWDWALDESVTPEVVPWRGRL